MLPPSHGLMLWLDTVCFPPQQAAMKGELGMDTSSTSTAAATNRDLGTEPKDAAPQIHGRLSKLQHLLKSIKPGAGSDASGMSSEVRNRL